MTRLGIPTAALAVAARLLLASTTYAAPARITKRPPLEILVQVQVRGTRADVNLLVNRRPHRRRRLACTLISLESGITHVVSCGEPASSSTSGPAIYRSTLLDLPPGDYLFSARLAARHQRHVSTSVSFTISG